MGCEIWIVVRHRFEKSNMFRACRYERVLVRRLLVVTRWFSVLFRSGVVLISELVSAAWVKLEEEREGASVRRCSCSGRFGSSVQDYFEDERKYRAPQLPAGLSVSRDEWIATTLS
ncbi:hypothetical protein F511_27955 [Dorcoceras hygrometricum]|uniref:Uncharacterized protein n=1 Tax=Dorcoceras hygrometricum TaxID=472368 RepID=A0A2Z7DA28_9LAMI|nr:hypothetical protein F511_27955 [Dorcoceras hygrometricum]